MPGVAYGEGSITRRADGRLQVVVTVGGKRRYAMIPARLSPKEQQRLAEKKRRELVDHRDAELDPSGQTLAAFLRSWIDGLRHATHRRVRPRTLDHYELIVERHIIPALGTHRLDRLSERHVQHWLDHDSASPRTVSHHRAVLRRALNVAVRQRIVGRNVAIGVELPPIEPYEGRPLSLDEARRLLAATAGDRLHPLWRLAIVTGLRLGELLGLGWDDLTGRELRVSGQLTRRRGSWVRSDTKAARALGAIALDAATVNVLDEHRRRMTAERTPDWPYFGLMFTTPAGLPYHRRDVLRLFHAACDAAGIPRRRVHDLRASSATLLRALGVPEDARMARLGHATTDMARHYAKASPEQDRAAADTLGAALG